MQQVHQTQQPAQVPKLPISDLLCFPAAFVVVAAQLDGMSSMSSSMSDQSSLTLTVPAEPTENDFIDNYDLKIQRQSSFN